MSEERVIKYINNDKNLEEEIDEEFKEEWKEFFIDHKDEIEDIFNEKIKSAFFFPKREDVFRFCKKKNISEIKVVIVGMDPYPSYTIEGDIITPVATGRSFEVKGLEKWTDKDKLTASLRNIIKTIYYNYSEEGSIPGIDDVIKGIGSEKFSISPPSEWFNKTEEDGVLWLNASLTVEPGAPGSHSKIWKPFMTELIKHMIEVNGNIKWVLWGTDAQNLIKPILSESYYSKGLVYTAVHPSSIPNKEKGREAFVKDFSFKEIPEINWKC